LKQSLQDNGQPWTQSTALLPGPFTVERSRNPATFILLHALSAVTTGTTPEIGGPDPARGPDHRYRTEVFRIVL